MRSSACASATICARCDSSVSASACAVSRDSRAALRAGVAGFAERAALGVERLARGLPARPCCATASSSLRARFARLLAAAVERGDQLREFGVDASRCGCAPNPAGPAGSAAGRPVRTRCDARGTARAARPRAAARRRAARSRRLVSRRSSSRFALLQRLDLARAATGSRARAAARPAWPRRSAARAPSRRRGVRRARVMTDSPSPSVRQQRARVGQRFGGMQLATACGGSRPGPAPSRPARSARTSTASSCGDDQRQAAFAEFAERIDQRFRRFDQHAFDQLAERAFDRVFPAGFDHQLLADARGRIQPALPSATRSRRPAPGRARRAAGFPATTGGRARPAPACALRPVRTARCAAGPAAR